MTDTMLATVICVYILIGVLSMSASENGKQACSFLLFWPIIFIVNALKGLDELVRK